MNKAEEFLKEMYSMKNDWKVYPPSENYISRLMEAYHQSRVKAISDEAKKYIKNIRYFKGDKTLERKVYHIEEEDFNKLLKQ